MPIAMPIEIPVEIPRALAAPALLLMPSLDRPCRFDINSPPNEIQRP